MKTNRPIGNKIGDFKVLRKIGSGGFATVYEAKCLEPGYDEEHVAIKMIDKKEVKKKRLKNRIQSEIKINKLISHSAIVQFFTDFEDDNYYYLVMELCERGTLEEFVKERGPLPEKDACDIIRQVIDGVKYLHSCYIIHRDLSMKNILLTRTMKVKIADFGMAAKLMHPEEMKCTLMGTANFMSPEVVCRQDYSLKVDCWSVGCVLYALLYGSPPFDGKEKKYMEIMNDAVMSPLKFPSSASTEARELLEKLLNKNPEERIDVHAALKYPFFQKYGEIKDNNKNGDYGFSSASRAYSADRFHITNGSTMHNSDFKTQNTIACSVQSDIQRQYWTQQTSCISTKSCSNLLQNENQECMHGHAEKPLGKPQFTTNGVSMSHLKNKIHALPSKHKIDEVECWQSSCSDRDYSQVPRQTPVLHERNYAYNPNRLPYLSRNKYESQIEDHPMLGGIQNSLPYPHHRLQHIVEDPPYYSSYCSQSKVANACSNEMQSQQCRDYDPARIQCSHEFFCAPEKHCSHEIVCGCRCRPPEGNSCHYSQQEQGRKSKDYIELLLDRNPRTEQKGLKDTVSPLNTLRLPPKRYTTKNAFVSILKNGQVCLEFFKLKKNKKYVNQVCFISRDGWTILLYKPKKNLVPTNEPPSLPNNLREVQYFNFETLPESHWKKYQYAKRFIDIVRAKTPKVTIYGKECKCVMMENAPDPDYELSFYKGVIITYISGKTFFTNQGSSKIELTSSRDLRPEHKYVWDIYINMKEKCAAVEASLEKLSSSHSDMNDTYFPVIIGRKSIGSQGGPDQSKENTTPQSQHSSALNRAISAMRSYDATVNTDCSPYQNSMQNSLSRSRTTKTPKPFKSIVEILQDLKDLPRVENDRVVAEYKDGIQMWSSMNGEDVYFYDTKSKKKLTNMQNQDLTKRCQSDLIGILFHVLSGEGKRKR